MIKHKLMPNFVIRHDPEIAQSNPNPQKHVSSQSISYWVFTCFATASHSDTAIESNS